MRGREIRGGRENERKRPGQPWMIQIRWGGEGEVGREGGRK